MNKKDLAKEIVHYIGGEENINSFTHCITRLRFVLKDDSNANLEKLHQLDGVITAQVQGNETQVVIGPKVKEVFEAVSQIININTEENLDKNKKESIVNQIINSIAGIFVPLLPVLVGCGMFKSLVAILTNFGVFEANDSIITILSMIGDLIFYFFPFFIAVSAAKKFKTNEFLALALAGALMYPTIMNGAASISTGGPSSLSFLGMPILFINYKSSVIPIILSVFILKYVLKFVDKYIPDILKTFLTPMIVLFIMVPLELIVIGPIGTYAGEYLAMGIDMMYSVGSVFTAAVVAGTRGLLTMLGMHYALGPLTLQQLAATGTTTLLVGAFCNNFAQAGAAFGTSLRIKDKSKRAAALSTSFSAVLGVSEPAMYGINLVYKRPFIFAMIGAAISGIFLEIFNTVALAYVPPGLFTIATLKADNYLFILIGLLIGFVIPSVLSYLFAIPKSSSDEDKTEPVKKSSSEDLAPNEVDNIICPIKGEVVDINEVSDQVFSSEVMGKGIAIRPSEGKVYAPFDGKVSMILPSKHAIGLTSTNGTEVLIHVGLNTVKENGSGFKTYVSEDDSIKKGDLLIEFDIDSLSKKYDMITPVLITNSDNFNHISKSYGLDNNNELAVLSAQ